MAYFSLHAYDADVWVPQFRGLNQAEIDLNPDMRFASEAENVETPLGVLQPQAAMDVTNGPVDSLGNSPKVETLAVLHRRWFTGSGSKNWYICAAGGKLYYKQEGNSGGWIQIPMPVGIDSFQSNVWSCVAYEDSSGGTTVDVLLMTNAHDGMIMVTPPDRPFTWAEVESTYTWNSIAAKTWDEVLSPQWSISAVETRTDPTDPDEPQKKFGVIERFGDRIFGTGVPGNPDSIFYSQLRDPTDWTQDNVYPDKSAGQIDQPSWDGDQFYGLGRFGDQLVAIKNNKVWRVYGTSPGTFVFNEQFGGGTEYFNTIAIEGEKLFMAGENGVMVYDGMDTVPYAQEQIKQIWATVNKSALDQMCAAMYNKRYYLAFPTGNSVVNNAMLVIDLTEKTILYYKNTFIESFLPANNILYATSSTLPGRILKVNYDSWALKAACGAPTKWVTPWMDFGYKRIVKGGVDFYFLPEVQENEVAFTISFQTEKKTKTKQYVCYPLSDAEKALGREHRMKRLHFSGTGRRFRIVIETASGVTDPWRLVGGLHLVVETDPD